MNTWNSIGGAICVAVTAVGLVMSFVIWRRKGAVRGMRALAWALIPLVAYLTGAVLLIGRIVDAIVRFSGSFVFSPKSYAGVIVLALAVVLFLVSGGLPLLSWRKSRERKKVAAKSAQPDGVTARHPADGATARHPARRAGSSDADDMSDIEEILRQRGIK
ncbi:MAG: cellulose synthase [Streptosporangiaceae bacterium]